MAKENAHKTVFFLRLQIAEAEENFAGRQLGIGPVSLSCLSAQVQFKRPRSEEGRNFDRGLAATDRARLYVDHSRTVIAALFPNVFFSEHLAFLPELRAEAKR